MRNFSSKADWQAWAKSFPTQSSEPASAAPFAVVNPLDASKPVEILIYDQIGKDWFSNEGVSSKEFAKTLAEIPSSRDIVLAINSPGGNVWEGLAIYNLAKARGSKLKTRNDGVAASIASIILLSGESTSPASSVVMIHKASWMCAGNSDDMDTMSGTLRQIDDVLAGIYAEKTGKTKESILAAMKAETWFSGAEAKAFGLVDNAEEATLNNLAVAAKGNNTLPKPTTPVTASAAAISTQPQPKNTRTTMEPNTPTAPVAATEPSAELKALQASFATLQANQKTLEAANKKEVENRISRDLDKHVIDGKCTVEEAKAMLPKCIADESLLEIIAKREPSFGGAAPLAATIQSFGNPTIEAYNKLEAGAERKAWFVKNGAGYRKVMKQFSPQNLNTTDSALVTQRLEDAVVTVATNKLALVSAFSRQFGIDTFKPLATVQVKKATAGATAQEDPTDFTVTPDSTLDKITVTMHQQSLTFHVTNLDMHEGTRMSDIAEINADTFCNHVADKVAAVLSVANFGTALTVGSAANFDPDSFSPILAVAKNYRRKNLILDGGHLAYVQPKVTDQINWRNGGAFGFDMIAEHNRWNGAAANAVGFVCGPDAVGIVTGRSQELPSGEYVSLSNVTLQNGIDVQLATWFETTSRRWLTCLDLMLGVAAGDTTQGEVLVTS